MSKSFLSTLPAAALAGGAMLALELSPASAFTLYAASAPAVTSGQIDQVYYRGYHSYHGYRGGYARHGYGYRYGYHGGYGYHRYGYGYHGYGYHPYGYGYGYHPYGWGGAAAVGAAALGAAAVGAAVAPHCWIDPYGYRVCN